MNVGDLIGFVHTENFQTPSSGLRTYTIGLAYSKSADNGQKWTYASDIIRPYYQFGPDSAQQNGNNNHNIGGVPYIVYVESATKDSSFYVYFNEYVDSANPNPRPLSGKRLSVARARVADVVSSLNSVMVADVKVQNAKNMLNSSPAADQLLLAIQNYDNAIRDANIARQNMVKWHKYRGANEWSTLNADSTNTPSSPLPVSEQGADIGYSFYVTTDVRGCVGFYDLHSDAAYCSALGEYLMTINTSGYGLLLLYTSSDGINWRNPIGIDDDFPGWQAPAPDAIEQTHSFFVDPNSEDGHVVGKTFYIIWPRTRGTATCPANYAGSYDESLMGVQVDVSNQSCIKKKPIYYGMLKKK
jgi:hypothetical protein